MRIRGTLYGSLLYARPEHAEVAGRVRAFADRPGPLGVEIGFDHGACILDRARSFPHANWLGVEIRRRRVEAAARHAPTNCHLARIDGRALLGAVLPPSSVDWLYLYFPTPHADRRALFSPSFVDACGRALKPSGVLSLRTDVVAVFDVATQLLDGWEAGPAPPSGTELSRRERVCRRDGLRVYELYLSPPRASRAGALEPS